MPDYSLETRELANSLAKDGEPLILNGAPLTAVLGVESLEEEFTPGGLREVIRLPATLPVSTAPAPQVGQRAAARGKSWRVFHVGVDNIAFELVLETPNK